MYAPRMSTGAMDDATACDVGIHSISPITNTRTTSATTGIAAVRLSSRNGSPIKGMANASLSAGGIGDVARVKRSWTTVTRIGLMTSRKPQVDGASPCDDTSEIGSNDSNATYVIVAKTAEPMKRRNAWSRRMTANEPRSGAPSGA